LSASDEEIHELVRQEAADGLQRMEANLLALESGEGGAEAIDAILRDAHSIKGSSAMVGWREATGLANAIEERMEEAREQRSFARELAAPLLENVDALRRAIGGGPASAPAAEPQTATIRVAASKVDRMLDVVGETVLHHRRLEHALSENAGVGGSAAEQLDMGERLLEDLQDSVVQLRTLPLSTITTPFPRAIRDLAAEEGKDVELEISGAATQLDRVILDGISETIVHVLRNAVAHGIENPQERESAGKPGVGSIELRAEQRGGMVAIEIADDGRGVSAELIERAAKEGSLVDILAETGFTTAAEVTEVAGRGVGLDAVKRHVESLGGNLEVQSRPGAGTEVTLLLPLTLALMRVLLFERDEQAFALPMASVGRVLAVSGSTSLGNRPSLELEGEAVPLFDLDRLLGAPARSLPEQPPAVVIESLGRRLALACDELLGEEEVVIKSLGALLAAVPGYLGAAILGDGRIALVLDPNHLLKAPREAMALNQAEETTARAAAQVLVVDDQFAARELQRSILETAGYRVQTAANGREALRRIGEIDDLDLVMTDVQMPEMDGFELLEAIRAAKAHSSLPVVIVTTLGDEASRQRGAEAGADAYIIKEEFNQQGLLETIERLVGR
jgi:two-component system, chemotaxis family, sensor kinase CheA